MERVRYTPEEDLIIISKIKEYPTNLTHAFEEAALILNRDKRAVNFRWYNTLKKRGNILTTGSQSGFSSNVKNTIRTEDNPIPEPELKGHLFVLQQILSLSVAERQAIIRILTL